MWKRLKEKKNKLRFHSSDMVKENNFFFNNTSKDAPFHIPPSPSVLGYMIRGSFLHTRKQKQPQ